MRQSFGESEPACRIDRLLLTLNEVKRSDKSSIAVRIIAHFPTNQDLASGLRVGREFR